MDSTAKHNETFKLLQLSEDSKSLSELDLPEIVQQRKRKVRRKTRPKYVSGQHNYSSRASNEHGTGYNHMGLWLALAMASGWLFILSYIIAVVHTDNRRLEIQIQKVSASSQNVPEALQKWHETSKSLEQNQALLNDKITEVQRTFKNFTVEFEQLKENIAKKSDGSEENQLGFLKNSVGEFGAKIKDIAIVVGELKDHYNQMQENINKNEKNISSLKTVFDARINETIISNKSVVSPDSVEQVKKLLLDQVHALSVNLTLFNDTLSQKSKGLEDDFLLHKKRLDQLNENFENVSSHVSSIEDIWTKNKDKLFELQTVRLEMLQIENATKLLSNKIETVQTEWAINHSQNKQLQADVNVLKAQQKANDDEKLSTTRVMSPLSTIQPVLSLSESSSSQTAVESKATAAAAAAAAVSAAIVPLKIVQIQQATAESGLADNAASVSKQNQPLPLM